MMDFEAALRAKIDGKTKPLGALGRIEALAAQVARVQHSLTPRMERGRLILFAADHGIAAEGVSAYPAEVTRQMVLNFLAGGAAANIFARQAGLPVAVVDCGVAGAPIEHPALIARRLASGTANSRHGPAMTADQRDAALALGRELAGEGEFDALCLGEMGIGNTSAAALLAAKITGQPVAGFIGRGTGVDGAGLARKQAVLEAAAARTAPRLAPAEALAEYGGFEIAAMAGAMLGAAEARRLVLVDGFIAGAAALVALGLEPGIRENLVFAHRSAEQGHAALLAALGAEPLLDLGLRLGEGSGALLAWPLLRAAAAMLNEMASFESAAVSGPA
ncbi:nicotinate-nucleotide--dimethylbenzimidazole phosphoribosyltransferase [Roseococcus sp. SDR]|uniref:nicotinate-nucleotide--dimethylbenzimidazole phosphoribosyltransferase n=1 Tax=Roseococcus sp. SDR TaxID=2835532 RepID=UPI001BCCC61F|nr:nicotinate-nucleotide--dimethylbenzimidazole phosphoribosyltransferase [Roseococcus sp. SDR]MBS7792851.1 nicotinate-nucleotide--dimethylbenzimidazole phosphoribosyltransferase [Roseococcus sp. SDR]MBV1848165.1 nicotinate-nucleotide--dimethylbenzimidazole phosphoribosyltransferase [Roseococcus sp. SDR]